MGIVKYIKIDDKDVAFRASAAIPRLYRLKFQRDIYKDLRELSKYTDNKKDEGIDDFSLEMFENVAYIMAKHADSSISDKPEEWLDQFELFSLYQALPEIIKLWGLNLQTEIETKKNFITQNGK